MKKRLNITVEEQLLEKIKKYAEEHWSCLYYDESHGAPETCRKRPDRTGDRLPNLRQDR